MVWQVGCAIHSGLLVSDIVAFEDNASVPTEEEEKSLVMDCVVLATALSQEWL